MDSVELNSVDLIEERKDQPITSKITAYDFAAQHNRRYNFGVSKPQTAAMLRLMADRIDSGSISPTRAQVTSEAHRADYTKSVLVLEFYENNS